MILTRQLVHMKANEFLEEKNIDFELVEQDNPTKDCDDAARERGIETAQIVKSLVVEQDGGHYHVCIPGDRKLSEKRFGEYRLADPETSKEITGQESGTVHPFASDLKHFVDERVFEHDRVSFTIGHVKKAVIMDSDLFKEALESAEFNYEVTDLVVTEDRDIDELVDAGAEREKAKFLAENGFRRAFLELSRDLDSGEVTDLIQALDRHDIDFTISQARKILDVSEGQTHVQKLVEEFSETGEVPDDSGSFNLGEVVKDVIDENPKAVEDYNNGRDSALNYLLGQVMQETQGRADGGEARKQLTQKLE